MSLKTTVRKPNLPNPLCPGDVVAIVAPGGPVDAKRLDAGVRRLALMGLLPEVGTGALARDGFLAGNDRRRAKEMAWGMLHAKAKAVIAARGGYGTTRLLPHLPWEKFIAAPKILVGFSDVSALLSYVATRLFIPTIHGPMPASDLSSRYDDEAADAFLRLARGNVDPHEPWGTAMERLRKGTAAGKLSGGCLSVLTALIGTPYEPDFRGALLFLEDVSEASYRVDRMLTQWIQSGKLSRITGIMVGKMAPVPGECEDDLKKVFAAAAARLGVPAWYGFPAGHEGKNFALPFGVRASVDGKGTLFLLESPVASRVSRRAYAG